MAAGVNEMVARMKERVDEALAAGSDLSEFPQSAPDAGSESISVEEMNERADRLRAPGGHLVAARGTFGTLAQIARIVREMAMLVVQAPRDHSFVTSDMPLVLRSRITGSPVGAGWANGDALAAMPMDPRHYLCIYHGEAPGVWLSQPVSEETVRVFNATTIEFADQEVYSPFECQEADDWLREEGRWDVGTGDTAEGAAAG